MRFGVISDVHGNTPALSEALERLANEVEVILLAGDAMHEYRFCNEVVEAARDWRMPYVLGNHELSLLGPLGERARSAPTIRPENLEFLEGLPTRWTGRLGKRLVGMVHGSPWEPYSEYLHAGNPKLEQCATLGLDILVLGHTHVPMVKRVGNTLIVNPGSLGESRESGARDLVSFAIVDSETNEAWIERFENPRLRASTTRGFEESQHARPSAERSARESGVNG
jgi:putative phosphoesterase